MTLMSVIQSVQHRDGMSAAYDAWVKALEGRSDVPDWDWVTDEVEAKRVSPSRSLTDPRSLAIPKQLRSVGATQAPSTLISYVQPS